MATASAILPLHGGNAPPWLFKRMVALARCITKIIVDEYGVDGYLRRLSDPWFFQSLSCVLGYDWHSSGTTTVTCAALKEVLKQTDYCFAICGGKGRTSRRTPAEILEYGEDFGLSTAKLDELVYSSRMSAKVDNSLIQDGYSLYHHVFIFTDEGKWIVIQQGINQHRLDARRYHWGLDHVGFIDEPNDTILCDTRLLRVLDMTSSESAKNRITCIDLVKENPEKIRKHMVESVPEGQKRLDSWGIRNDNEVLVMPRGINWDALRSVYEFQPTCYEEFASFPGVGPSTIRGLALIAELIYGDKASWRDPVRFNFAFGGKDGVPFPVDRVAMDESIGILKTGITSSDVKDEEKKRALQRLRVCVPSVPIFRFVS